MKLSCDADVGSVNIKCLFKGNLNTKSKYHRLNYHVSCFYEARLPPKRDKCEPSEEGQHQTLQFTLLLIVM